jgi:hypothetical protein
VTRLDTIKLEELALICLGSIEEAKMKVILGKMAGMSNLPEVRLIRIVLAPDTVYCGCKCPAVWMENNGPYSYELKSLVPDMEAGDVCW